VICFIEVRFLQTYSPLRWSQRPGFSQPFPSLKRSPRPSELFSLINGSLRPLTRTTTTWCLLLNYKLLENKNGGRRKAIQATRTQMNTNISLSLVTICLEWFRTSTVGALIDGAIGQSDGAPDRYCSLSGAPSGACSDSACIVRAL
jgi:hypothetical protein